MIFRAMAALLMLFSTLTYAFEKCPADPINCSNTTLGKLEYIWGQNAKDGQSHILLNGKEVFKNDSNQIGRDPSGDGFVLDKNNNINKIIFYYFLKTPQYVMTDPKYGELYRYVAYRLLDFSGKEVVISNEFYPPVDYDPPIKWVSWGQKNSVIAFEDGSRFRYENGHVTMINAGSESEEQ